MPAGVEPVTRAVGSNCEELAPTADYVLIWNRHFRDLGDGQRLAPAYTSHPVMNQQKLGLKTLDVAYTEEAKKMSANKLSCDMRFDR